MESCRITILVGKCENIQAKNLAKISWSKIHSLSKILLEKKIKHENPGKILLPKDTEKNPENPNGKKVANGEKKSQNLSHLRSKILSLKKGKSNLQCAWWNPLRPKPLLKSTLYSKSGKLGKKSVGKKSKINEKLCCVYREIFLLSRVHQYSNKINFSLNK